MSEVPSEGFGIRVLPYKVEGRINYKKLVSDLGIDMASLDMDKYRSNGYVSYKITMEA